MPKFDLRFWTIFNGFEVVLGGMLGQTWAKKYKTSIDKLIDFWMAFGRALGCQMEATRASGPPVSGPRGEVKHGARRKTSRDLSQAKSEKC